jgi:hypothetical protein
VHFVGMSVENKYTFVSKSIRSERNIRAVNLNSRQLVRRKQQIFVYIIEGFRRGRTVA